MCWCHDMKHACSHVLSPSSWFAEASTVSARQALLSTPLEELLQLARTCIATSVTPPAHSPPPTPSKKQQQQSTHAAPAKNGTSTVGPGIGSEQREALAAAEQLLGLLAAARDARAMRQHQPGVDASQFCSGDTSYQRKVGLLMSKHQNMFEY